jgi:hypothetical protein
MTTTEVLKQVRDQLAAALAELDGRLCVGVLRLSAVGRSAAGIDGVGTSPDPQAALAAARDTVAEALGRVAGMVVLLASSARGHTWHR